MRHRYAYTHGMELRERFEFYREQRGPDECWPWTGTRNSGGYGVVAEGHTKQHMAHRLAYLYANPEVDLDRISAVDHLCHTAACGTAPCSHRLCQNPAHLRGTNIEGNVMRGESPAARNARKTHCQRGHEFDLVRVTPAGRIGRDCSVCKAARRRRRPSSSGEVTSTE